MKRWYVEVALTSWSDMVTHDLLDLMPASRLGGRFSSKR